MIKADRHIRWNWEPSPDNSELARYHFIIVDDRDRQSLMNKIIEFLLLTGAVERIRRVDGKVKGDKCRYLFESYDSRTHPNMIEWSRIPRKIIRDKELRERKVGNIEDYVSRVYEDA